MKIRIPLILRNIVLRLLLMSALSWLITGVLEIAYIVQKEAPDQKPLILLTDIIPPILVILHHTLR